ncbi:hypothetical protein AALP_AA5G118100 [Arabis alpina]|uniref:Uncharacterized protein n=1 Tax=Arabis alpina TaxID=50452 RepID=A0A087GWI0_ARAAL|nr:hypothetical protein AALP_AA5G118100 [Arabis alpina]
MVGLNRALRSRKNEVWSEVENLAGGGDFKFEIKKRRINNYSGPVSLKPKGELCYAGIFRVRKRQKLCKFLRRVEEHEFVC